jgi:hypothetical protein
MKIKNYLVQHEPSVITPVHLKKKLKVHFLIFRGCEGSLFEREGLEQDRKKSSQGKCRLFLFSGVHGQKCYDTKSLFSLNVVFTGSGGEG